MLGSLVLFMGCLAALLSHGSLSARAGITIQHQPVGCLVAEKFPTLESHLDPAEEVASARVYFKGESGSAWYYVEMKRDPAAGFRGVLPKPRKDLARVHYYIETTARDLTSARTEEFTPDVVANAAGCKGRTLAAVVGSASVVVSAASGASAIPLGFSASGVAAGTAGGAATGAAAGGGGLGTPAIVVGAAAVVAGAAVVVKKAGGDSGDTTASCGANSLTVLERSGTTLRLQWSFEPPGASGSYTVDYLTGVASCSDFPPHGNILPLQGTSVNLTGLTPDTMYHIHVHPLTAGNAGTGEGTTNVVFVRTLPAGSAPQPTTRSDYQSCCGSR